jgi:hypothetical protein
MDETTMPERVLPHEIVAAELGDDRLVDASGAGRLGDWLNSYKPRNMSPERQAELGGDYYAPGVF